jgi:hypothetical protein
MTASLLLLLLLFLPFLLSLVGRASMAKLLCFMSSLLALLLSVEPYGSVLPWLIGMIIAVVAVVEWLRSSYFI